MKPLHVLDMSLPHVAGYTTRAASLLAGQISCGLSPVAVTGVRQTSSLVEGADHDDIQGVRIWRTKPWRGAKLAARAPVVREVVEMSALYQRVVELGERERPDVIHAHSPILCGLPAYWAARRLKVPSVYEIRAFWEDAAVNLGRQTERSAKYAAIRRIETSLAGSVDALVVICEGIRRELMARGLPGGRIFTVPNGVDAERFAPRPRDEGLVKRLGFADKTVVAYVGTLFRFEGVSLLLKALKRVIDADDSVRGLVVGYGETEQELRALHAELGLGDKVRLTGKVSPGDVAAYYSIADVLCYPRDSHRITELTTPLKPLEALAMEKAVVGSDVGGIRELVRDGETGLLHRAGDAESLVATIQRLVAQPELRRRLGEAGRRDMIATRDWKRLAQIYLDVYAAAGAIRERAEKSPKSLRDTLLVQP